MPPTRPKSPFEFTGGNPCLDFADTVDNRTTGHPQELLTDYGRLLQWGEEAGVITAKTAERLCHLASREPGRAVTTLRTSIQLRDAIYVIFSAVAQRRVVPSTALACLNKAVRQAAQHAQLVYASRRLAWEWIDPGSNLDSILWPVSRAAAELLIGEIRSSFHGTVVANIASGESCGASAAANFVAHVLERLFAATHQEHASAEHGEMQRHGTAEAGASAGQKNSAVLQHVLLKHGHRPRIGIAAVLCFRGNEILVHSGNRGRGFRQENYVGAVSQRVMTAGTGRPMALAYSAAKVSFEGNSSVSSCNSL